MIRCYITDHSQLDAIAMQLMRGIELIQIRERHLTARDLQTLAGEVLRLPNPHGTRILINDRADVALATGASGVHLRGHSVAPSSIRAIAPAAFLVSVSCHSVEDVRRAADEGADIALLAPVYATPGKGQPLGLGPLNEAARAVRIPVLALGGITEQRIPECMEAGAAGVAGISMFVHHGL
jgi:thiamine-phosphate pyrophosphorylase